MEIQTSKNRAVYINNMADLQQSYPDPETFPHGSHLGSVTNDLV